MNRRYNSRNELRRQNFSALVRDAERRSKDRLRRGRAKTNQHFRLHQTQFRFEPWSAGCNLARVWFLMNATLAPWLPFEMFDCVGHVHFDSRNASFLQRAIEN